MATSAGEDVGGTGNYCNHYGNQYGTSSKNLHTHVYCDIIHNSQVMESVWVHSNRVRNM
jgi:hypothetical protein